MIGHVAIQAETAEPAICQVQVNSPSICRRTESAPHGTRNRDFFNTIHPKQSFADDEASNLPSILISSVSAR